MGKIEGMTTARLVLDTNVLLSALVFHSGELASLRGAWRSNRIRPLACRNTTAELIRVLGYPKFNLTAAEQRDLLDDYLPCCEVVILPHPPPPVPDCRDPFDRPFLELALVGRADALVSGDTDILTLAGEFVIPIIPPKELKAWIAGAGA